jgi:hypothetical protein
MVCSYDKTFCFTDFTYPAITLNIFVFSYINLSLVMKMEEAGFSKTLVATYQTAGCITLKPILKISVVVHESLHHVFQSIMSVV